MRHRRLAGPGTAPRVQPLIRRQLPEQNWRGNAALILQQPRFWTTKYAVRRTEPEIAGRILGHGHQIVTGQPVNRCPLPKLAILQAGQSRTVGGNPQIAIGIGMNFPDPFFPGPLAGAVMHESFPLLAVEPAVGNGHPNLPGAIFLNGPDVKMINAGRPSEQIGAIRTKPHNSHARPRPQIAPPVFH